MKHLGDIRGLDGSKIQPVDIITCGSPCQDMSIAGRRDGLEGSRSSLFFEARRWLKNPHSDSAEYRMWGNRIVLPCARYVLTGIANHDEKEKRQ